MSQLTALVPIKDVSERVPEKNFRPFFDTKSLLELKIEQLIASKCFEKIIISSDSLRAKNICVKYGVDFKLRDKRYCDNKISWSEVIYNVVNDIGSEETMPIAWIHATSPLFSRYQEACQEYSKAVESGYDGLVATSTLKEFIVSADNRPLNYHWGVWHPYSQMLPELYRITGAFFISTKENMKRCRYVIAEKPKWFMTNQVEGIDIDTEEQFKLAQLIYINRKEFCLA